MKLGFLSNDVELYRQFETSGVFSQFVELNSLDEIDNSIDVLVMCDDIVDLNELQKRSDEIKEKVDSLFFIFLKAYTPMKMSVVRNLGVSVLPPEISRASMVSNIAAKLGHIKLDITNNIFTFFGADGKVGTTMVAQSVAERLSLVRDIKILYLALDGTPGTEYFDLNFTMSLDNLKTHISNGVLSISELREACERVGENLFVLRGAEDMLGVRFYHPEHIETLLTLAKAHFDVVIVDAGSKLFFPMSIAAVNSTPNRFLVTTQQANALRTYERVRQQVLSELKIEDFTLILNRYVDSEGLYDSHQLAELYNHVLLTVIPNVNWGILAESDRSSLVKHDSNNFVEHIDEIVKVLGDQLDIDTSVLFERPSFFRRVLSTVGIG